MQHKVDYNNNGEPDITKLPKPPEGKEYKFVGEDLTFDGVPPKAIMELVDVDEKELAKRDIEEFKAGQKEGS